MMFHKIRTLVHLLSARERDPDRIAMLIYLIDWRVAQMTGRQATDYQYVVNIRGPRLMRLEQIARENASNTPGILQVIGFGRINRSVMLDQCLSLAVDQVLDQTNGRNRSDLLKLVRGTAPVRLAPPNGQAIPVDLGEIANAEATGMAA